jgi:hypothetical protein
VFAQGRVVALRSAFAVALNTFLVVIVVYVKELDLCSALQEEVKKRCLFAWRMGMTDSFVKFLQELLKCCSVTACMTDDQVRTCLPERMGVEDYEPKYEGVA